MSINPRIRCANRVRFNDHLLLIRNFIFDLASICVIVGCYYFEGALVEGAGFSDEGSLEEGAACEGELGEGVFDPAPFSIASN